MYEIKIKKLVFLHFVSKNRKREKSPKKSKTYILTYFGKIDLFTQKVTFQGIYLMNHVFTQKECFKHKDPFIMKNTVFT